jgi:hypothetical protein
MSEPYLAHPVSPMEAATIGLAAAAVPVISTVIISRVVNGIVDVFVPLDERKERDKFYKHTHKVIKDSSLPDTSSTLYIKEVKDSSSEQSEVEDISEGDEWTDHVERAKAELDTAHKKVRCGKCKKDIAEVKNNLETRTNEMVRNAKKHKVMTTLQKQGKIKSGKTWKQLTPNEKKMIKLAEA